MSPKLHRASVIAVAATFVTALAAANGSGAIAQDSVPVAIQGEASPQFAATPVVQPLPAPQAAVQDEADAISADSLAELVSEQPAAGGLSEELQCLAGAIYFEAKGESLPGQLAVGRVITARSKSGRFPGSYCGVVYQRSQFSFVRGRSMPGIDRQSRHWRNAVAVARIADSGSWRSPVEGALFFHAAHVAPKWRLTRIARVDNHVFYR
jgi:N-acetylmuramoyl-L-alanine amidase